MIKILIANEKIEDDIELYKYLSNYNGIELVTATNGLSTLEKYYKIRPDIFILNTNLKDINYIDIINKLSCDNNEKINCNTILISNIPNEHISITNVAKIYKIFTKKPKLQELLDVIMEMSNYSLDNRIDLLFLKTKISLKSTPSDRVRDALVKCYYDSNLLLNLNQLFDIVGKDFNTTRDGVRSSFRTALNRLNLYKDKENPPFAIYKFFDKGEDITPKNFLDISTYFLKKKNNR